MEKILLNRHENQSEGVIDGLYKFLSGINELIQTYNNLPGLKNLETEKQVMEFLRDSMHFLDNSISTELRLTISPAAIRPRASEVAKLFGIDYYSFNRKVEATPGLKLLQHFKWNIATKKLEIPPSEIQNIKESYFEYTESDEEVKEVRQIRQFCTLLNKHVKRYKILNPYHDFSLIASELNIKFDIENYTFSENIETVRMRLAY